MLDAAAWHQAEHLVRGLISDIIEPFGVSADVTYTRGDLWRWRFQRPGTLVELSISGAEERALRLQEYY